MTVTTDRSLSVVRNPFDPSSGEMVQPVEISHEPPVGMGIQDPFPMFEGMEVKGTVAKLTSTASLEIDDRVLKMDQTVTMLVQCRVLGIDHKVHEASGDLRRVHLLKAIDSKLLTDSDFDTLRNELT